jgi:hypothetical protein
MSEMDSNATESSYTLDDPRLIDERQITDLEISRIQAISSSDQSIPEEYGNYRLTTVDQFKRLFEIIQNRPSSESGVKPGELTALTFATQLRTSHLEVVLKNLERGNQQTVYSGTIGYPIQNWQRWITTIRNDNFSDIYDGFRSSLATDPIDRESTPTGFSEYIKIDDTVQVNIHRTLSSHRPEITPILTELEIPMDFQSSRNYEDDTLFLDTSSRVSSILPSLSAGQDDDELLMHSRIVDQELRQLHSDLSLNVTFTDLYLNTIHILCNEFSILLAQGRKITRLSNQEDSNEIIVFRMLRIFAMSSQPPFDTKVIKVWRPALHLELFFSNLINPEKQIQDPKIRLKYYTEGETLTTDRYAMMSKNFFKVKEDLYSTHELNLNVSQKYRWT